METMEVLQKSMGIIIGMYIMFNAAMLIRLRVFSDTSWLWVRRIMIGMNIVFTGSIIYFFSTLS